MKKGKILVATPSASGYIKTSWVQSLLDIMLNLSEDYMAGQAFTSRSMIDDARNELIKYAQKDDADYILFIDDDTFITPEGVRKLMALDKDIVSCPVADRTGLSRLNIFDLEGRHLENGDLNETMKVGGIGMACTLIKRAVFDKLLSVYHKPFEFQLAKDKAGRGVYLSEDIVFCYRAAKYGFETWAVTGIRTKHMGENNYFIYEG